LNNEIDNGTAEFNSNMDRIDSSLLKAKEEHIELL